MQKTRDGEGAQPGCGGTRDGGRAIRASGRSLCSGACSEKIIHMMSMDNLRRKMQIGLQLLLFQAVEGQEMAPLGGLALEWAPGTC